jgi:hypothetical protein
MGLLALLFGGVVALDSTIKPSAIETQLVQIVRRELKQVDQVSAHVEVGGAMRAMRGDFHRVELELRGFKVEEVSLEDLATVAPDAGPRPEPPRQAWRTPQPSRRIGFPTPLSERLRPGYPKESTIGTVVLNASSFTYAGIPVGKLTVEIRHVRYNVEQLLANGKISIQALEKGTAVFKVGAEALRAMAAKELPEVSNVKVRLEQGRMELSGTKTVLIVPVRFACLAGLGSPDGQNLTLVDPKVRLVGLSVPARIVRSMMESLKPVFHVPFEALAPLEGYITGVAIAPGGIEIQCRVSLPRTGA